MKPVDPRKSWPIQELKQSIPLMSCRIDPKGRYVFAGCNENKVLRWELATGKLTTLLGHRSWVRGIAFQPSGELAFTAGYDGKVLVWPVAADKPEPSRTLDAHQGWVRAVAVSPDGQRLATCGNDQRVCLWHLPDCRLERVLEGHTCHVYNVAFHPKQPTLVSADLRGIVKEWDLASGNCRRDLDAAVLYKYDPSFRADIGGSRGIAFSPDGSLLACSGITEVSNAFANVGKPLVVLFDLKTGQRKQLLRPKDDFTGVAWGVICHPDGFLAGVGGGAGGALWFWKPDQPQAFHTIKLSTTARDLDLHPDGRRLAVAGFDGAVRFYEMAEAPKA